MDIVYIETSIVSHASARPSQDPVVRVLQDQARNWWDVERANFELVTSQIVLDEAALGDPIAASERLNLLSDMRLIRVDKRVENLANAIISQSLMPRKAYIDALHVACAVMGNVQYLLTLNCRHIANAHTLPRIYSTIERMGYVRPLICTPAEFLGGSKND